MSSLLPNPEAAAAFLSNANTGRIVMLNLLKFKPEGGGEAYNRYIHNATPLVQKAGGQLIYAGRAAELLVGGETWDAIVLVEYPSRAAVIQMFNSPEYQAIHGDREAGLERTVLYATDPVDPMTLGKED